MTGEVFAAIDVGSYEMALKIFELSDKRGVKELDHVRHRMDLGSETYATGKIGSRHVEEMMRILTEFRQIMKTYGATHYKAYGTSAIRETRDIVVLQELIRQRTHIQIDVLSNSEQRFLDYKSIALKNEQFQEVIKRPTAIIDIGGGSIQISLFEKDALIATQNLKTGVLRLHAIMQTVHATRNRYFELISELVGSQLAVFSKMYLKDRKVENLIIIDDYVSPVVRKLKASPDMEGFISSAEYNGILEKASDINTASVAKKLDLPEENIPFLYVSGILIKCILDLTKAENIWAPGVTLCDGIAYEYAEKKNFIKAPHDFEHDIISCAQNISKRYMGSKSRRETLWKIASEIFDNTKKIHGLSKRERLLLQVATMLHDCGKYISMINLGDCSFNIIMSTEIIGLSHKERAIVANVVRYNHEPFDHFGEGSQYLEGMSFEDYLVVAKLTAIIRVANSLDRTHKQKFRDVKVTVKDRELIINIDTRDDITLEKGLFTNRAQFFEEVFGIKPVIKQKKMI
ncbi:MAG: HD domain-containing protein [Butyrivibrio sp.]|nr:HD domain-containing protein [Butyrivibrio sp.]